MKFIRKIIGLIFPATGSFDFSEADPEKLLAKLPRCVELRGATALAGKHACAALSYKHPAVRALVWRIKFKRDAHALHCGGYILYRELRRALGEKMKTSGPVQPVLIIPMPISSARRRERGYNQCELLAKAMLARGASESETSPAEKSTSGMTFELRTDILARRKNVKKQTFKNRRERMENMRDAFEVRPQGSGIRGRTVILVDDVITTGSTLREAAACLERAGFTDVRCFGLAH